MWDRLLASSTSQAGSYLLSQPCVSLVPNLSMKWLLPQEEFPALGIWFSVMSHFPSKSRKSPQGGGLPLFLWTQRTVHKYFSLFHLPFPGPLCFHDPHASGEFSPFQETLSLCKLYWYLCLRCFLSMRQESSPQHSQKTPLPEHGEWYISAPLGLFTYNLGECKVCMSSGAKSCWDPKLSAPGSPNVLTCQAGLECLSKCILGQVKLVQGHSFCRDNTGLHIEIGKWLICLWQECVPE